MHLPVSQALSQHTPSAQNPLAQSDLVQQAMPMGVSPLPLVAVQGPAASPLAGPPSPPLPDGRSGTSVRASGPAEPPVPASGPRGFDPLVLQAPGARAHMKAHPRSRSASLGVMDVSRNRTHDDNTTGGRISFIPGGAC